MRYKAKLNVIIDLAFDETVATVVAPKGAKRLANRIAQFAVDRLNADERAKVFKRDHVHEWTPMPNPAYSTCSCGAMKKPYSAERT